MKKRALLLSVVLLASLVGCGPVTSVASSSETPSSSVGDASSETPSSSEAPASSATPSSSEDTTNYGTAQNPIDLAAITTIMSGYAGGALSPKLATFKSVISTDVTTAVLSGKTVYDFDLSDGTNSFTCYHVDLGEGINAPEKGDTVTITGYLKKYANGSTLVNENGSKDGVYATIIAVTRDLTGIVVKTSGGETSTTIAPAATVQLVATADHKNAALGTVTWDSVTTSVATVSDAGLVTAVANGTSKITATVGTIVGEFTVTVDDGVVAVTSVTVTGDSTVVAGKSITLTSTKTPEDATATEVTWASSDETVATVNSTTGVVTGKKSGTTNITATIGGVASTAKEITVTAPNLGTAAAPLTIEEAIAIIDNVDSSEYSGDTTIAYITGTVKKDYTASGYDLYIQSGDLEINVYRADDPTGITKYYTGETILAHGWLTKYNTTYELLSKQIDGEYHNAVVDSVKGNLTSITLSGTNDTNTLTADDIDLIVGGSTSVVTATVLTPNSDISSAEYKSSDPTVAKVEVIEGVVTVTALSAGETTISCKVGDVEGTLKYIVTAPVPVSSVTVTVDNASLDIKMTAKATAVVSPDNVLDKTATWTSSDTEKVTIDSNGIIKAIAEGTAKIYATVGGVKSNEVEITVSSTVYAATTHDLAFDSTTITDFESWGTSYAAHSFTSDKMTVSFDSANHSSSTVTDVPVTKNTSFVVKVDKYDISTFSVSFKQWNTKTQSVIISYSTDGGTYTACEGYSKAVAIDFTSSCTADVSSVVGVRYIKVTYTTSNQVGTAGISVKY